MTRRFGTAITLTLVVFTLLPVTILGSALVRQAGSTIRTDAERDLQLVAQNLSDRITQQLATARILAQNLAGETDIFLATRSMLFWRDAKTRMGDFLDSNPLAASIALIDTNDRIPVALPEPPAFPVPASTLFPAATPLLKRDPDPARRNIDTTISGSSLYVAIPVRTQSGMPGRARLLVEFTFDRMHQLAAKALSGGLSLELQGGSIPPPPPQAASEIISATSEVRDTHFSSDGLISIRVTDPTANRFRAMRETVLKAAGVIAALAAVAGFLAFAAARYFLSPLGALVRSVAHLSDRTETIPPPTYRFHEFQLLGNRIAEQKQTIARQFDELNATVENLQDLNERLREMRTASEHAQLNALKAQMNPHLLFNTLNSILSMMDLDVVCASKMLSNLADLYRLILGASKKAVSDVATEVTIVSLYLELERVRFADRMLYRVEVAPSARSLPIPGLVLQTLVENAVKHGIAKAAEGGDVELRIESVGPRRHVVRISNSGSPLGAVEAENQGGTGLENTRRRLELLYGKGHEFRLFRDESGRTVAEFFMVESEDGAKNSDC